MDAEKLLNDLILAIEDRALGDFPDEPVTWYGLYEQVRRVRRWNQ